MNEEPTCLDCEHFYFEPGDRGYSDMTPGYDCRIGCYKNHWELDTFKDNTTTYRKKMLTAISCLDLEDRKEETAK